MWELANQGNNENVDIADVEALIRDLMYVATTQKSKVVEKLKAY